MARFLGGARELFLLHSVQAGYGAHPSSNSVGTGSTLPGVKRPRREADNFYLVRLLRISGVVPPLWRDQINFILYFIKK